MKKTENKRKRNRQKKSAAGRLWALWLLIGIFHVSGCASTELEQRSFPLAVGIDLQEEDSEIDAGNFEGGAEEEPKEDVFRREVGDSPDLAVSYDFPDLAQISEKGKTVDTAMGLSLEGADMYHVEKSYENNTNRVLDYNHMKAVVLGENVFSDTVQLRGILSAWEQREASARNTSLLIGSGSAAEILSLTEETEGSMGTYLEEMLESQKDFKQNKIATVGNLMNQWHNQDELLLIPVLTEQGKRPVITGYGAVSNFNYQGILTVEDAMKSFLCQNLLKKFTCEPAKNLVVEISDIRAKKTITLEGTLPVVTVRITGKGRLKTGQVSSVSEQYQLEKKIEKQLTADLAETAGRLQQEYGIDVTNSFISLGSKNRSLYRMYRNYPDAYNQEAQHVFQVEIAMLNWE
ncbi:MAG: hypothetical protein HFH50_12375 [Lachnospiraceae bacterium]|nr:hypothetical protein [Lachnospiraceae bacterium]MCI9059728.1 hypothetical protein [Lachnospiraceae bacterium]